APFGRGAVWGGGGGRPPEGNPRRGTRVKPAQRARAPHPRPQAQWGPPRPRRPHVALGPRCALSAPGTVRSVGVMALPPQPGAAVSAAGPAAPYDYAPGSLQEKTSPITGRTRTPLSGGPVAFYRIVVK